MNKLVKVISSGFFASLMVATTIPFTTASAVTAGNYNLTSSNFRAVVDFDKALGVYKPGMKPGSLTDRVGVSKNRKAFKIDTGLNINVDFTIVASGGQSGNALLQEVLQGAPETGAWEPFVFHMENAVGTSKIDNVEGATDFMFWVDTTQFKDPQGPKKWVLTIQETDVKDGKLNPQRATFWCTKSAEKNGIIYKEQNGKWVGYPTCKDKDTEGNWFPMPEKYKGWIRIPISSLCHNTWANQFDSDNKFNGKQLQLIAVNQGDWASQKGSKIIWDSFGFYGNFAAVNPTPSTSSKAGGSTASNNNSTASGTTSNATSSSASSAASSSSSASSTDAASSDATSSNAAASSDSASSAAASTSASPSNHVWVIVLIVVLVLAAAGVGGFFLFKKIRKS